MLRQLTDIRQGPAPSDSNKAVGQRGRLEQQQRDLFESMRDRVRADSIARAERLLRDSLGLKPIYLQSSETVSDFSIAPTGGALLISTRTPASARGSTTSRSTSPAAATPRSVRTKVGDPRHGRIALVSPSAGVTWLKPFAKDTITAPSISSAGTMRDPRIVLRLERRQQNDICRSSIPPENCRLSRPEDTAWVGGYATVAAGGTARGQSCLVRL
jgi:hypothetical protein